MRATSESGEDSVLVCVDLVDGQRQHALDVPFLVRSDPWHLFTAREKSPAKVVEAGRSSPETFQNFLEAFQKLAESFRKLC